MSSSIIKEMTETREWVDWQNTKVLQKVAIEDEAGNILVLKRIETGPASRLGKADLVGGSLGPEDLNDGVKPHEEGISREALQETGLKISEIKVVFVSSWVFTKSVGKVLGLALGYQAKVEGIKPEIKLDGKEHVEYYWLSKEEALNADFGDDGGLHKSIVSSIFL